ncbi:MAG TPA: L-threonylcarbamoyladenylate synthase [Acidobacteriaceae bacterium]
MTTLRLYARPDGSGQLDPAGRQAIERAAAILRGGGTVAFATETVYGLGANALDPAALARVFLAKQRPAWDPLIVHVAEPAMLARVAVDLAPVAHLLIDRFWPGPLTLLVPRHSHLPSAVTAGRELVGVRMPAHPVARALIQAAGVPLAAPSANTFGHLSPTTAAHVLADLDGRIEAVLDSGDTTHGLESTVLDTTVDPCLLYRPGAIPLEQLRHVWPAIEPYQQPASDSLSPEALPSPGLDIRHYAPRAALHLVQPDAQDLLPGILAALEAALEQARPSHARIGLMLPLSIGLDAEQAIAAGAALVYAWGEWSDLPLLARRLFAGLRTLDEQGADLILCPLPPPHGLGTAIRDRLQKAARRI